MAWENGVRFGFPAASSTALRCGLFWGDASGPNPTDRSKNGCKRHVIDDARGLPMVVETGPANEPDGKRAMRCWTKFPPSQAGGDGHAASRKSFKETRPTAAQAIQRQVVKRGIRPLLAPYGNSKREHGSGLGRTRYVVEQTLSWFGNSRRLKLCYGRTAEHFQAFHELAASLICFNRLTHQRK